VRVMEVTFGRLFAIFLSAALVNNFVLHRFLGLCPFIGVSRELKAALGMGGAVIFVMTLASAATWAVNTYILKPLGLDFLYIVSFILVIASLVQFVEMFIRRFSPPLYRALGIYLPLITTNCAVLGVALYNRTYGYNLVQSVVNGLGAGVGFTIALCLMAGIRERLDLVDVPEPLKGVAIAFITAGLMSMAFLGFAGLAAE